MKKHDFVGLNKPKWGKGKINKKTNKINLIVKIFIFLFFIFLCSIIAIKTRLLLIKSTWDGRHNLNMVVAADKDLYILSFQPEQKVCYVIFVPAKTYIPLSKGFGSYPASSIWKLGQLESFGGGLLLQQSAQRFLGVPITGWGRLENSLKKNAEGEDLSKTDIVSMFLNLGFKGKRNLTAWDLARVGYGIYNLPSRKIIYYSLSDTRAGEEATLPDGEKIFNVRQEYLDNLVKNIFKDAGILQDDVAFEVINKTDYSGLAGLVARTINNIGGEVASFSDDETPYAEGIYCSGEKICSSYTVLLFSKAFNLGIFNKTIEENKADSVIILGEKYWQFYYKR